MSAPVDLRRLGWIFAGLLFLGNFAAAGDDGCLQAQVHLDKFIFDNTKRRCTVDQECDGFNIRVDSCVAYVVLAKKDFTPYFEGQLLKAQKPALEACAADWANRAACAPAAFKAQCKDKLCVDAIAIIRFPR